MFFSGFNDLPAFLAEIEPVVRDLGSEGPPDVVLALARHARRVIAATALGAGVEEAWLGEQTPEVLVDLAAAVLEVNLDFFVQVLAPRVAQATVPLARLSELGSAGPVVAGGTTGLAA